MRFVFDASAKQNGLPSLNDYLYKGPNLIESIPDILDRIHPISLSASIEKAFLQLAITSKHRFFFFNPSVDGIIYRHCQVVFDVSSSPFLLAATINHVLDKVSVEYTDLAQKLKSSFYIMLQEILKAKIAWKTPLPNEIQQKYKKWIDGIKLVKYLEIKRYVEMNSNSEMHIFVDASKFAYTVCIFLKAATYVGVKVHLLIAKTRVAPLKSMFVSRLELMACRIRVRLALTVLTALKLPNIAITYWSDSMVALW